MRMRWAVLVGAAALLAGCSSVTSGAGPTSPADSGPPSQRSSSGPVLPSTPPSGSIAPPPRTCVSGNDFCDTFGNTSSGWPVEDKAHYFARYDSFNGGTYRMGERTEHLKTQLPHVDTTTLTSDDGVQVDVDAVLAAHTPATSYLGIICWDHTTQSGAEAGFVFFVTAASVDLTLIPDTGTALHTLAESTAGDYVAPYPASNHLTATCEQKQVAGGAATAMFTLAIDGTPVLHASYRKSVKNYPWSTGGHDGLIVAGPKSDVYYDNFAITGV